MIWLALLAFPGTIVGAWLGARTYHALSDRNFRDVVLGLLFLGSSIRAALSKSNQHARQLLLASVLYLPLLFGVMVLNR